MAGAIGDFGELDLFKESIENLYAKPTFVWILAISVFIGAYWFCRLFLYHEPICTDGWRSTSIGSRGACSHHGGVDRWPLVFSMFLSGLLGYLASFFVRNRLEKDRTRQRSLKLLADKREALGRREPNREELNLPVTLFAPDEVPPCPLHGRMVLDKLAERWECGQNNCDYYFIIQDRD